MGASCNGSIPSDTVSSREHSDEGYGSSFYGIRLVQVADIPIEKWIQVTKELQVSLFQTMILLLFNDPAKKSWTLEEIEAETRIGKHFYIVFSTISKERVL